MEFLDTTPELHTMENYYPILFSIVSVFVISCILILIFESKSANSNGAKIVSIISGIAMFFTMMAWFPLSSYEAQEELRKGSENYLQNIETKYDIEGARSKDDMVPIKGYKNDKQEVKISIPGKPNLLFMVEQDPVTFEPTLSDIASEQGAPDTIENFSAKDLKLKQTINN